MPPESDFTEPSEWCPHPERWNAANAGTVESEVQDLIWGLVRAMQPDYCVEIGAYQGHTSEVIGEALAENGHGRLAAVEINEESAAMCRERCEGLPVDVVICDAADFVPGQPVEFALLDSGLDRDLDLDSILPYCKPGTVIAIHDTAPGKVANYFRDMSLFDTVTLRTPRGLTLLQVGDE